jgi:hypothetical protein
VKLRYLRTGDALTDNDTVVVREGALDANTLRDDASRYFAIYGINSISVFAARGITVDELAQEPPLVRFEVLTLITAGELRGAGFKLQPTGRNSHHFTVAWDDLDAGVAKLLACEHKTWRNPYHDG